MNWKDSLKFKGSHDYRDSLYVEPASRDQMFIFFNYFIAWVFMSPVCLRPHTGGPEASVGQCKYIPSSWVKIWLAIRYKIMASQLYSDWVKTNACRERRKCV